MVATPTFAQQNLSFELNAPGESTLAGWSLPRSTEDRGYRIDVDTATARDGGQSLRIAHLNGGDLTRVVQRISVASLAGANGVSNRVRLSGYLRSENVAAGDAVLWLRVDGPGGFIAVDSRGSSVAPGPGDQGGWTRYEIQAPIPDDAREIAFGALLRGAGTAWFDDFAIQMLDARTLPAPSATARRYIDAALEIMQQHSINRGSIDWQTFRAATLDQARGSINIGDAHLALRFALRNLGDHHSYFVTPQTAASLDAAPVGNARTGRKPVQPSGVLLDGAFGYVALPGFAGGTPMDQVQFAESIHQLIKGLDSSKACGWILDLRGNSGGDLWPMLAGIGPLLDEGEIGASLYPDGSRIPVWYRDGKAGFGEYVQLRVRGTPYRVMATSAPLALLIGSSTASAGEVILMAFHGRENTLTFGAPTRGLSTGNRIFPLSDGAELVLTVAATSDRSGRVYSGSIAPDRVVPEAGGAVVTESASDETVTAAALAWLKQQTGCD
ncbi:MAG TPA: S41 family peptidase [Gammaproteobacteria bacterium]|nr:S41 family peptidase [Gammaproteobacteria bacterium]